MFENIDKKKALIYGGVGVCILLLIMMLRGASGGSGSTSVVSTGPSGEQLQAQTQLALAQISAGAQQSQVNAQIALQSQALQVQYATHEIDADIARYSIDAQREQQRLQITADASQAQSAMTLQASIARWTLDNAAQMQANNNAFQLDYANAANSSMVAMANIQAGVIGQQLDSNERVTVASLQAQAAQLASYLGAQTAVTESNNAANVAMNSNNNRTTRQGNTMGMIGSVIGGIASIFSDRRVKTDIHLLGRDDDGLGAYAYRYIGDRSYQVGVMADEVAVLRPEALGPIIEGVYTVNYGAL